MGISLLSTGIAANSSDAASILLIISLVFYVVGIVALVKFFQIAKDVRLMRYRMDNIYQTLNKMKKRICEEES